MSRYFLDILSEVIYPGNNLKVYSPDGLLASSATAAMSSPLFVSGDLQFEGCGLGKTIPRLYGSCVAYLSHSMTDTFNLMMTNCGDLLLSRKNQDQRRQGLSGFEERLAISRI